MATEEKNIPTEEAAETPEETPAAEDPEVGKPENVQSSVHFGDEGYFEMEADQIGTATWGEVFETCCCHTPQEWGKIAVGIFFVCFFLYFFLIGLELLGTSAKVLTSCSAGALFGDDTNAVASLMIGILATVLLQSSSTTTSIIVSLVGADVIATRQGIYMVMGANIGTSVTNTIVAMGHLGDGDQLERAFAGATVHDMFNFLSVGILFPVELITGYLFYLTKAMVPDEVNDGDSWDGPVKKIVSPLADLLILENKNVVKDIAKTNKTCDDFYPIGCEGGVENYESCTFGLIACDKDTGNCPAFYESNATREDDQIAAGVCLVLSLVILIGCLIGLVTILQKMLLGTSTRIIYKATNINGYLGIVIGCLITMLVQSSSITTSTLTPLVGLGVLRLEQMLPLTLGANIGTTVTGLLSALVSGDPKSLQVALAHLFFNITGIIIWFPFLFMRNIPLGAARRLGKMTRIWRGFPVVYIAVCFFLIPLALLGISQLFTQDNVGFDVLGSLIVILIFGVIVYYAWWFKYSDGLETCHARFAERERKRTARENLADDMEYLKSEIERLREHTGLEPPEADEEGDEKEEEEDAEKEEEEDANVIG